MDGEKYQIFRECLPRLARFALEAHWGKGGPASASKALLQAAERSYESLILSDCSSHNLFVALNARPKDILSSVLRSKSGQKRRFPL